MPKGEDHWESSQNSECTVILPHVTPSPLSWAEHVLLPSCPIESLEPMKSKCSLAGEREETEGTSSPWDGFGGGGGHVPGERGFQVLGWLPADSQQRLGPLFYTCKN